MSSTANVLKEAEREEGVKHIIIDETGKYLAWYPDLGIRSGSTNAVRFNV